MSSKLGDFSPQILMYSATEVDTELQNSGKFSANSTGTNTKVASMSPALSSYTTNSRFFLKFVTANTGAVTININGLGAKALTKNGAIALVSGDIAAGQAYAIFYDGTQFQILGKIADGGGGITLEDEGSTVSGGPHTTLDFVGKRVSVADAGGGEATATFESKNSISLPIQSILTSGAPSSGFTFVGDELCWEVAGMAGSGIKTFFFAFAVPDDYIDGAVVKIFVRRSGTTVSSTMNAWINNVLDSTIDDITFRPVANTTWEVITLTFGDAVSIGDVINLEGTIEHDAGPESTQIKALTFNYNQ